MSTATVKTYDPNSYAEKRRLAMQRAKEIRERRKTGILDEECSFKPKTNKRSSKAAGPDYSSLPGAYPDESMIDGQPSDSLDNITKQLSSAVNISPRMDIDYSQPEIEFRKRPDPDALAMEVRRTVGLELSESRDTFREISRYPEGSLETFLLDQPVLESTRPYEVTGKAESTSALRARGDKSPLTQFSPRSPQYAAKDAKESGTLPQKDRRASLSLLKSKMSSRRGSRRLSMNSDDNQRCSSAQPAQRAQNSYLDASSSVVRPRSHEQSSRRRGDDSRTPDRGEDTSEYHDLAEVTPVSSDRAHNQQMKERRSPTQSRSRTNCAAAPDQSTPSMARPTSNAPPAGAALPPTQCTRRSGCTCIHCCPPETANSNGSVAVITSATECTRRSGCPCPLCDPNSAAAANVAAPVPVIAPDALEQCDMCGRKFLVDSLAKHQRVCKKVFQTKRKALDMTAARVADAVDEETAGKVLASKKSKAKPGKSKASSKEEKALPGNKKSWKASSSAFREAMRQSRNITKAIKEGKDLKDLPPVAPAAPDPSLIPCPHCGRRFNEQAAERHIPKCQDIKAKPKFLKRGAGVGLGANARAKERAAASSRGAKTTRGRR